jgi:DNA polymerase-3 subunit delta'
MLFHSIIGNLNIRKSLVASINKGNFSHASLIVGEDGIGKSYVAYEMALNILGRNEYKEYVDIQEYRIPENKKSISVDQIRDITEEINKKPYESNRKVIILHNSDKMTIQAQNAFLKSIEEPPNGVFLILLCENQQNLLDTIKSRCEAYKLSRLSEKELDEFLIRKYPKISEEDKRAVKVFSDGIPGRIEDFLDNAIYGEIRENTIKMLLEAKEGNLSTFLKYQDFLVKNKNDWQEVLTCILSYIRDIILYKEIGNEDYIINLDKIREIKKLSEMFSYKKLNEIIDIVNNTKNNLQGNVNAAMAYRIMLLKIEEG